MCGINGIVYSDGSRAVDRAKLMGMRETLTHRGPDEAGLYVDGNVGLAHRRLSIVDLKNGQQPMATKSGRCVITYNGEIYNHADFRDELISKGHTYRTRCDTEAILHLYEEYGVECLEKLRGMFAFAIWDKKSGELFAARDRLGVKPLYYYLSEDGSFYFASEMKAILRAGIAPELNYSALPDQLANHGTSHDETLFKNIKRLLPGHYLIWKDGRVKVEKYWDLSFEPKLNDRTDAELVEEWRSLFDEAVRLRLMADVPLGVFLSGGIDSSAICGVMAQTAGRKIKSFSVGFSEREANEFRYARLVSKTFDTDHHEITITPERFFNALPQLVWHEDEPIGFMASVPLYFVSKFAADQVKVVLTGEGSDETLAGYARYSKALDLLKYGSTYNRVMPRPLRQVIRSGVTLSPSSVSQRLERTFLTRESTIEDLFFDNFSVFPKQMLGHLLTEEAKCRISDSNPFANQHKWLASSDARSVLDKLLYSDTKSYLHELLMKQDQMSMAASLESRVPFLDHKLVEFSARMPDRLKLRNRETKWVLRQAMRDLLPSEIIDRGKMGFPVPIGKWFRTDFADVIDEYVLSERARRRRIFDPIFVRELVVRHQKGENHSERLWALVNFEIWQRIFFDGETASEMGV